MSDMENDNNNDGETESDMELGLPLFRPFTRSKLNQLFETTFGKKMFKIRKNYIVCKYLSIQGGARHN